MSTSDQPPKLPLWPFLLIDAALLSVAWVISDLATNKFAPGPLLGIVACVVGAAVAFACPFIVNYARAQDAALDERQRALDSLARTVTTSAEQISVATNGLNEIAELTQKALRHADHLPQKLSEKVAELQAQLTSANDVEKEELEKEVAELRAGETERLQSTAEKIAKSSAEWAKLEAATQKHLSAATDALAKAQAQTAATIDEKLAIALAALDTKLAALAAAAQKLSELPVPATAPAAAASVVIEGGPATITSTPAAVETTPGAAESPAAVVESSTKSEGPTHPPKRPRKPRRVETAPDEAPSADAPAASAAEPHPESKIVSSEATALPNQKIEEPPPVIAEKIPEVTPAAPHTAEPFKTEDGEQKTENSDEKSSPSSVLGSPSSETPKAPRKRAPKKPEPAVIAEPSLGLDEPPAPPPAIEVAEPAISSDGATRLLVTAYIGIGNRLFIRGDGPGLSWEKGVPLQFVSIGKWRWETSNATAPVKFKLYKNDDAECTALGAQSLAPGQQQEMTAAF